MKKGSPPLSNFSQTFLLPLCPFQRSEARECSTRFFRVPLSGGAGSALFRKERHRRVYQAGLFFRQAFAAPCPPLGGHRAHHAGSRPPVPYFCHTGHGPLVRGKTLGSSFSFLYYTYHNIFQILLQRHDAAATAEPHPLRFCMVERPQAHRARNARGSGGLPYPRPRAYRRPACLAKGAQLCYNVKNNRYGGNRIWSF